LRQKIPYKQTVKKKIGSSKVINKIDKPLDNPIRKRRKRCKLIKLADEKEAIKTNINATQRIIWKYSENLY
jgi:hypothetical protein